MQVLINPIRRVASAGDAIPLSFDVCYVWRYRVSRVDLREGEKLLCFLERF